MLYLYAGREDCSLVLSYIFLENFWFCCLVH